MSIWIDTIESTTRHHAVTVCLTMRFSAQTCLVCVCVTVLEQPHPGCGSQVQRRLVVSLSRNPVLGLLHAEPERLPGFLWSQCIAGDTGTCEE